MTSITAEHLARLLREAADAHHAYETTLGKRDEAWPEWYADYIVKKL